MSTLAMREPRLFEHVHWRRLLAGFCLTAVLSLSVHSVMIDILHVPYPSQQVKAGARSIPYQSCRGLGLGLALWRSAEEFSGSRMGASGHYPLSSDVRLE
jgi:hypothetical protein